jgi:hypothetical protein
LFRRDRHDASCGRESIRLRLSTLAEQIRERDEENKAEESRTVSLRAQSARYLDRLINAEVALPALDVERAWDTAVPGFGEDRRSVATLWRRRLPALQRALGFLVAFGIGRLLEKRFPVLQTTHPAFTIRSLSVSSFVAGWFACVAVLPISGGIYALAHWFEKRHRFVVSDSPAFMTAIQIWQSLLFQLAPTPRDIKKFLNQVRLLFFFTENQIPVGNAVALFVLQKLSNNILEHDNIDRGVFEGLELGEGKPSRPVLRGPGGRKAAWLLGSNPKVRVPTTLHLSSDSS